MTNKHLFLLAYTILATFALSFTSCSSDDDANNTTPPIEENQSVINMMKGSYENATKFGRHLYINESNNFAINYDYSKIASVGKVKGLANIGIPNVGYTNDNTAILKGYGYVYYDEHDENLSRLFVEDAITDPAGNILGYKVAYEKPFYGKNQDIKLPKYEIAYDSEGGCDTLLFTDGEPMVIDCETSSNWCGAERLNHIENIWDFPASWGIIVYAHASDSIYATCDTITLKTKYGKEKTIKVTRAAADPRISFGEQSEYSLPVNGGNKLVFFNTNIPFDKIEIDNSKAKWCKAECGKEYYYSNTNKVLILTAESNETDEKRNGSITLKYKDGTQSATINIVQDAPYIECDYNTENYYTTSYSSGYRRIYFKSNIMNLNAESNVDWINVDEIYANGLEFYCYFNNSEQSREGIITISDESGKITHKIKVVQSAY